MNPTNKKETPVIYINILAYPSICLEK